MTEDSGGVSSWRCVLTAVLVFLLLGADVLSMFAGKLLDGRSLSDAEMWNTHWYATVGMFLCSVTLWSISSALILRWAARRGAIGSLFGRRMDRGVLRVAGLGLLVLAIVSWLESSRASETFPSLVKEFRGFEQLYPGYGAVVTAFQYLYYALESVMVLLLIAFFQCAGEGWFRRPYVPWGGIGLTLTWGMAHFASHPQGAYMVVVTAFLLGLIFIGVRKSAVPALAAIWLVFVL